MFFSEAQSVINPDHVKRIEFIDETLEIHFIHLDNSISKWKFNEPDAQKRYTRTWQTWAVEWDKEISSKRAFKDEFQKRIEQKSTNDLIHAVLDSAIHALNEYTKKKPNWFRRIFIDRNSR